MTLPYSEFGDGSAMLLLHAGIADRRMWDEHLEPLAEAGHRVVAVDLPGGHLSSATRLEERSRFGSFRRLSIENLS